MLAAALAHSVPLGMSTGGETRASQRVRGRGGRAFAVDRLLYGGDEISEEHLGRRGLDAVFGIDMRVLEILGEETIVLFRRADPPHRDYAGIRVAGGIPATIAY